MSQPWYRSRAALAGVVLASLAGYGSAAGQGDGKIPITTTSAEAKQQYVKGRALAENLRGHDSRQFLGQAASRDPKFALAHYSLALSAPTAKDFFEHLKQAAALSDKASEGEQLMILGLQAGANADPKAQRDYYQRLVAAYPRDERAHFLLGGAYFGQQDMPKAIQEYRRAVEVAPDFAPAETWKVHQAARNDGDRRGALFTAAVIYADEGKFDQALAELQKEYAVAEKINDAAAMSADVVAMGDVLLEAGKPEEARKRYLQAVELVQQSDLSEEVKQNNQLVHHYNLGRVAARAGDLAGARQHATTYMNGATARKNDPQIKQAHELMGTIALAEKKFDQAIADLSKGNQQDAYTLYRLARAYQEKGDEARASELFQQVANQNTLPALNYSFVRAKAKKMKA